MTPFDPAALVAMLTILYPIVSGATFARARAEQPDYFAGGVIFGSKGDKLRLPDGREFDCIVAAGGPQAARRWWCSLIPPGTEDAEETFGLEAGPLEPLFPDLVIFPGGEPSLVSIVAGELGGLDGADAQLDAARDGAINAIDPLGLELSYRYRVEPAAEAHANIRAALDGDNPIDLVERTNRHDGEIDGARGDYVEDPPPDDPEPDPGDPPGRERDDDDGPGKENV